MPKSITPKTKKVPISDEEKSRALKDAYALKVGKVSVAWNSLHTNFLFLFSTIVNRRNPMMGMYIWDALASDSAQRDMLKQAAKAGLPHKDELLESVIWYCEAAKELAGLRNAFIHTHIGHTRTPDGEPKVVPAMAKNKIFESIDNDVLFCLLISDLEELELCVNNLSACVGLWLDDNSRQIELHPRPALQSPSYYKNHNKETSRPLRKKASQPQPQSPPQKSQKKK